MATTRYFITTSANFDYSGSPDTRAQGNISAHVFLDGASSPSYVLGLGAGIAENEYSPGKYKYDIEDFEIVSATSVSVKWYAHEYSSGNEMDDYPLTTTPTPATSTSSPLTVSSSDPTSGETDVSTRDALVITFSEDLDDSETLQNHQMLLKIAGTTKLLAATKYVNPDNARQLIVKPQDQLPETTTIELQLPNDSFYADSGAQLAEDYKLKFTTGADDFSSLEEVASDGTPERRAGPLVISGSSTVASSSSSTAGLESSDPVNNAYNVDDTTIDIVYDKNIDGYTPTVELEIEPLFGINELYFTDDTPWDKSTDPTLPVVDSTTFIAPDTVRITLDTEAPQNALMTFTVSDVDSLDSNYTLYDEVDAATTADIGATYASGGGAGGTGQFTGAPTTIDGYSLNTGDRILVKDQSTDTENGIYEVVSSGTWDRASDMDEDSEAINGAYVYVENGTVNEDKRFVVSTSDPITLNTTGITWTEVSVPVTEADEVSLTFISELSPFWVGVPEVRNAVKGYIADDITDTDIATYIANVGIDMYYTYGSNMKHIQRCIIKNQVAMDLFDDWLSDEGAGEAKTLGAFSVKKGPATGMFSKGPYARLAKKLDKCQQKLDLYFNRPKTTVKSIDSLLERPNYRFRTWRRSTKGDITDDENRPLDRYNKLPGKNDDWS